MAKLGDLYFDVFFDTSKAESKLKSLKSTVENMSGGKEIKLDSTDASNHVKQLSDALNRLNLRMSDTGMLLKEINMMASTADKFNKLDILSGKSKGSYNALSAQLQKATSEFYAMGDAISAADKKAKAAEIISLKQQIAAINGMLSTTPQAANVASNSIAAIQAKLISLRDEMNRADPNSNAFKQYSKSISELEQQLNRLRGKQSSGIVPKDGSIARLAYDIDKLTNAYKNLDPAQRTSAEGARMLSHIRAKRKEYDALTAAINRNTTASKKNGSTSPWQAFGKDLKFVNNGMKSQVPLLTSLTNMAKNYVGIWGAISFYRSIMRITAEFERQYVALKAIMQSSSQAQVLYNQLQALAVRSPYQFSQLLEYTKQLSAFQIPNNQLYDTTKRLADLSAGLGVDMSRIILAYGQVRSASVLRGQELRQFTEAGIPMVQELANHFSKLRGEVVTTGDVFQMVTKKMVSFEDVKAVIDQMTGVGGKFYNHQLMQANTLYGKVSNLKDSYQIMVNQMGKSMNGLLVGPVDALTNAMRHWRDMLQVIAGYFVYIGSSKIINMARSFSMQGTPFAEDSKQYLLWKKNMAREAYVTKLGGQEVPQAYAQIVKSPGRMTGADWVDVAKSQKYDKVLSSRLFLMGKINAAQLKEIAVANNLGEAWAAAFAKMGKGERIVQSIRLAMLGLGGAIKTALAAIAPMLVITALFEVYQSMQRVKQEAEDLRNSVKDLAKGVVQDIDEFLESHKDSFNAIVNVGLKVDEDKLNKAWESLDEELRNLGYSQKAGELSLIPDLSSRNRQAIAFLRAVKETNQEIERNQSFIQATSNILFPDLSSTAERFSNASTKVQQQFDGLTTSAQRAATEISKSLNKRLGETISYSGGFFYGKKFGFSVLDYTNEDIREWSKAASSYTFARDDFKKQIEESVLKAGGLNDKLMSFVTQRKKATTDAEKSAIDAQVNAYIQQFETGIEKQYNYVGSVAADFESYVTDVLMKNALKDWGGTLDESQAAFSNFTQLLYQEAQNSGYDIQNLSTDQAIELANKVTRELEQGLYTPTWDSYNRLRNKIIANPLTIYAFLKVVQDDINKQNADNLFKQHVGHGKTFYDTGLNNGESLTEYDKRSSEEYNTLYEENVRLKKQRSMAQKNGKIYNDITKQIDTNSKKQTEINQYRASQGLSPVVIKSVDKANKEADRASRKADEARRKAENDRIKRERERIKRLSKEYELIKKGIEEYEKFAKAYGEYSAIDILGKQYSFKRKSKSGSSILDMITKYKDNKGGLAELYERYAGKSEEAQYFNDTLEQDRFNNSLDKTSEVYSRLIKELERYISLESKRWELYDTMISKTGDEDLSALLSFGNYYAHFDNNIEDYVLNFNRQAQKMKVPGFLTLYKNRDNSEYIKKAIGSDELEKQFNDIVDLIEKRGAQAVEKVADAFANLISYEDKIKAKMLENNKLVKGFLDNALLDGRIDQSQYDILSKSFLTGKNSVGEKGSIYLPNLIEWSSNFSNGDSTLTDMARAVYALRVQGQQEIDNIKIDAMKSTLDYFSFFNTQFTMSLEQASAIANQLKTDLYNAMENGAISSNDYIEQLDKINERLNEIRENSSNITLKSPVTDAMFNGLDSVVSNSFKKAQDKINVGSFIISNSKKIFRQAMLDRDFNTATKAIAQETQGQTQVDKGQKAMQNAQKLAGTISAVDTIVHGINGGVQGVKESMDLIGDMQDALGKENTIKDTKFYGFMSAFSAASQSATDAWDSLKSGNIAGVMKGVIGSFTNWWTGLAQAHDARLDKQIQLTERQIKIIQSLSNKIQTALSRTMGSVYTYKNPQKITDRFNDDLEKYWRKKLYGKAKKMLGNGIDYITLNFLRKQVKKDNMYYTDDTMNTVAEAAKSGSYYDSALALLKEQRDSLQHQYDLENNKKKKNKDALRDYQDQIDKLDDQIQHFAEDLAKALYGIDFKSWADTLSSTLVDAWKNGTNAADAYKQKVSDILMEVAKKYIALKYLQPLLEPLMENTLKDIEANDGKLSDTGFRYLEEMYDLTDKAVDYTNTTMNGLEKVANEHGVSLKNSGNGTTLGKGIQQITEDTANLLASYVNAIRADVSVIRMLQQNKSEHEFDPIAQSQITQLTLIAANTLRNADAAERIETAIKSVITVGSNGAKVRV